MKLQHGLSFLMLVALASSAAWAQSHQDMLDVMNKQKAEMCSPPGPGMAEMCAQAEQGRQLVLRMVQEDREQQTPGGSRFTPPTRAPQSLYAAPAFGPLPLGIGTPAQRSFWAARCQDLANDGSPAARGCQQTRSVLRAAPAMPAPALNVGGLSHDGGSSGNSTGIGGTRNTSSRSARPVRTPSRNGNTTGDNTQSASDATADTPVAMVACVADRLEGAGSTSPRIILTNSCGARIFFSLCVDRQGDAAPTLVPGQTAAYSESHYDMWLPDQQRFTYSFRWSANDPAPAARC